MNTPLNIVKTTGCNTSSNQDENEREYKIKWEGHQCLIDNIPFYPKIAPVNEENLEGYNTVIIPLDGQTKSELKWDKELERARALVNQGYRVLWSIDLGLFNRLPFSVLNKSQLMTLSIAIEHFLEKVWPEFEDQTVGITLFEGDLNFSQCINWNDEVQKDFRGWLQESYESIENLNNETGYSFTSFEETDDKVLENSDALCLYCADLCVNYLDILAGRVPDELACFAFVDASQISSSLLQARILSAERAEHVRFVIKNSLLPANDISWDSEKSPYGYYNCGALEPTKAVKPPLGVCLPETSYVQHSYYEGMDEALEVLLKNNTPFRIIPEALLTTEWDGLDDLIVATSGVSVWGLRKLQGFCAAGGRIVTIGSSLDVAEEISFSEWMIQHRMQA